MRFAFFLSTFGGSPLQVGLERGLRALGHDVVNFHNGRVRDFDVLIIFNQCAHTQSYAFPDFPAYDVPIAFVDTAEYGYFRRLPKVVHNYANAFSVGSMNHDTKSIHEQTRIKNYLAGKSYPYFLREFSKYLSFPENYHPIDYPLYHYSVCSDRPDRGDYLRRTDDLFLSWGASHPWRWAITNALRACSPHSEIKVIEENGTPRMEQSTYFNRMVRSRCSVSFDGYGSSSFRMTEVLVRTLLLLGPLSIRMREPLVDGVTCVNYDLQTSGDECTGTNVCDKLREVLGDVDRSYRIYEAGFHHCMTYYTEQATGQYLVDTINRHDWSKVTAQDVEKADDQRIMDWEPLPNFGD